MDSKHDRQIHNEAQEEPVEAEREEQQLWQTDDAASQAEDPLAQQIAELLGNETEHGKVDVELMQDETELLVDAQADQYVDESSSEEVLELSQSGQEEEELNRVIEELCTSKAEEFMLLGYEGVTGKDIWEFVSEHYQYHQTGIPPLHKLINDILSLRVTAYMNWLTLSAYKGLKFNE